MNQLGDRFYSIMGTAQEAVRGICGDLHEQGINDVIRPWFKLAYYVIQSSVPLFEFCVQQLQTRKRDELTDSLIEFYRHKIDEESGHDRMLARDLERFGLTEEMLAKELPPSAITAMVGTQYYGIAHYHPAIFLGYLGFLEGYPPSPEEIAELAAKTDIPDESWSTIRLHVNLDPWHKEEIATFMNDMPGDEHLARAIIANGIRVSEYYCQALEGLKLRHE